MNCPTTGPIRLWLDDERQEPEGWTRAHSFNVAMEILDTKRVVEISLDHDLGLGCYTGYDLARQIEELAHAQELPRMIWHVHSANPVGRKRIENAMNNADRFWSRYDPKPSDWGQVQGGEQVVS